MRDRDRSRSEGPAHTAQTGYGLAAWKPVLAQYGQAHAPCALRSGALVGSRVRLRLTLARRGRPWPERPESCARLAVTQPQCVQVFRPPARAGQRLDERSLAAEPVKHFETRSGHAVCAASWLGSLIQATVGSLGGSGLRCRNLAGLAA